MKRMNGGFSLIELVVVIIVLGVLSVTALPKFVDLASDARISSLKYFTGVLKQTADLVYAKQQIENDVAGDAAEGISLYGTFIQTSYGYIDGGSANDFLSVLDGDVAVATNLSEPCEDASFCLNSRAATRGFTGLTLPSTNGSIVIVFPRGYTRNDRCFGYYWFSQEPNEVPQVGVIEQGC